MEENYSQLEIGRSIVHMIKKPQPGGNHEEPFLTDYFADLQPRSKELLREKLISLLKGKINITVKVKEKTTKNVVKKIKELCELDTKNDASIETIIDYSKQIAHHYNDIIDSRSNDCLFFFQELINDSETFFALMILEFHVGVQASPTSSESGQKFIDIKFIEGLFLSKQTRLFKIAYFPFRKEYDGIVCDTQSSSEKMVATFFIQEFLECDFIRDPKIATRDFFKNSMKFINAIKDSKDKYKSTLHLHSYIHSIENIMNPTSFANLLESKYRQDYLDYLRGNGFPIETFFKDTSKIIKEIEREVIDFEIGVTIMGNPEKIKKNVKMERPSEDSNEVAVSFQSKISKMGR